MFPASWRLGVFALKLPDAKKPQGKVGRAPKSSDEEVLKLKTFNPPPAAADPADRLR
jgi:hypothetical protein